MKNLIIQFSILIIYNLGCYGQNRDSIFCIKRDTLNSSMEFCYNSKESKYLITNTNGYKNVINFFSNGRIKSFGLTVNSYPAGYHLSFYENGKILSEGYYRLYLEDSKLTLKITSNNIDDYGFMDSGDTSIIATENIEYFMPKEGVWKFYYPTGKLKQVCRYKVYVNFNAESRQIKDGIWEFYNDDGKLIRITKYQEDKIIKIQLF
jgi:antitoxin component YwqK of YwqJK toxin-antitoxin module